MEILVPLADSLHDNYLVDIDGLLRLHQSSLPRRFDDQAAHGFEPEAGLNSFCF